MAVPIYPHQWPPQRQGWGLLRQLAGAFLLEYVTVEGTGNVPPCSQYIKTAGREGNEEDGRDRQCRLSSLALTVTTGEGGFSMSASSQCAAAKLRRCGGEPSAVLPRKLYDEAAGSEANGEVGNAVNPVSVNSTFYIKMK